MSIAAHNLQLKRRLAKLESSFEDYYSRPVLNRYERWHLLEGLISQTWQVWCSFCRSTLIDSCLGTRTSTGTLINPTRATWISEPRVCYEVTQAANNHMIRTRTVIASLKQEFTWGDIDKLTTAISFLRPGNHLQLLAGFAGGLAGPKHLQTVRNAAAHVNIETQTSVKSLTAQYYGNSLLHPTDLASWTHIASKNIAFLNWTAEMLLIADVSTE